MLIKIGAGNQLLIGANNMIPIGQGMRRHLKVGCGMEGSNLDTLRNKLQNLKISPNKSMSKKKKNYISF